MLELLIDEEDYLINIKQLKDFAESQGIPFDGSSRKVVEVALTMMIATELDADAVVMLGKLIYNVGYRDNNFKTLNIH
jgi:hypothetical protein